MKQDEAIVKTVQAAIDGAVVQNIIGRPIPEAEAKAAIAEYLSALDKAGVGGWTVVQKHAITMGQMDAGERALAGLDLTTATPEQIVQRVYFATVQASPPPPGSVKEQRE